MRDDDTRERVQHPVRTTAGRRPSCASSQHQPVNRTTAYDPIEEEEDADLDGYDDDAWPPRLPNSTRRYQIPARAGVERNTSTHTSAGRSGRYLPAVQAPRHLHPQQQQRQHAPSSRRGRRPWRVHWLLVVGIGLFVMISSWLLFSALSGWWQTTQDDWHYGRPRTFQIDAVVGHHDSAANPSHFIALNLNRHVFIIELPGETPVRPKSTRGRRCWEQDRTWPP